MYFEYIFFKEKNYDFETKTHHFKQVFNLKPKRKPTKVAIEI